MKQFGSINVVIRDWVFFFFFLNFFYNPFDFDFTIFFFFTKFDKDWPKIFNELCYFEVVLVLIFVFNPKKKKGNLHSDLPVKQNYTSFIWFSRNNTMSPIIKIIETLPTF